RSHHVLEDRCRADQVLAHVPLGLLGDALVHRPENGGRQREQRQNGGEEDLPVEPDALHDAREISMSRVSSAPTVTETVRSPRSGCHTRTVYVPAGRGGRVNFPSASGCTNHAFGSTTMNASMLEWMSQ